MKNSDKIILDLCGGTGAWSKPYKDAGYDVRVITLPEFNVLRFEYKYGIDHLIFPRRHEIQIIIPIKKIYGVFAAPPCTMFSIARTKAKTPRDLREGMECVRACLDIIWKIMEVKVPTAQRKLSLKFWALENPSRGFLKNFLGKPAFIFNPYDFGENYQKETALWGHFNEPESTAIKNPFADGGKPPKFDYMKSKDIHPEKFGELSRQERRAITPAGFATAFFKANL